MDHLSRRDRQHDSGEKATLAALESEGRTRDMDVVRKKLGCKNDVAEVYSPPRIVTVAQAAGLRGGFSLDLTAPDPDGHVWDFSVQANRVRARKMLDEQKPYVLIGSPPCTAYSNLQHLNECRPGGRERVKEAKRKAKIHLLFCTGPYKAQMEAGRYFLREHPESATSWYETCMADLAAHPMVMTTTIDQCAYGLKSRDKIGEAPAKKPTRFLTDSVGIKNELGQRCRGCERHVQLVEGRARAAQQYPKPLCRAVTRGIISQARMDAADLFSLEINYFNKFANEINDIQHDPRSGRAIGTT